MLKKFTLIPFFGLLIFGLNAQPIPKFGYFRQPKVFIGTDTLNNPFAGGINNAQPSFINLNGDTLPDLAVFDRSSSFFTTFVAERSGTSIRYIHKPEYEFKFPRLSNWALLRDYDGDDLADIFTFGVLGLDIWKNIGSVFNPQFRLEKKDVRTISFSGTGNINLSINPGDIPAIFDYDGDGDLDIFSVAFGSGRVDFNKNLSVERFGHNDSLIFKKEDIQWGSFSVPTMCFDWNFFGTRTSHLGSTINFRDTDNDGDLDLLMGDVSCSPLYSITNLRTNSNPLFRGVDSLWPNQPIAAMSYKFPASYNLDINKDGVDELIVSTNFVAYEDFDEDFQNSVWLYKQTGTTWSRPEKNWLQNTQIDVGSNAHPALADIDADGDLDLIIGTKARVLQGQNARATLALYRNIGTAQNAVFSFETSDWLSISSLNLRFVKPVFVDVNNDGSKDLLFSSNPSSFNGEWRVFINQSQVGPYQFTVPAVSFSAPMITQIPGDGIAPFDYDNDGDLDFLVGRDGGFLNLVINTGTATAPNYQTRINDFGRQFRQAYFELNPCVADFDGDGNPDLITGNSSGHLRFYNNIRTWQSGGVALIPDSSLIMDPNTTVAQAVSLGSYLAPTAGDLNGDGWADLVIGFRSGGVRVLYNSSLSITGNSNFSNKPIALKVYPNPGNDEIILDGVEAGTIEILDLQGRKVYTSHLTTGKAIAIIATLQRGTYLVRHTDEKSGQVSHCKWVRE